MPKLSSTILEITLAAASLFISTDLLAAPEKVATVDTVKELSNLRSSDSTQTANSPDQISTIGKWVVERANSNEGFITLAIALVSGGWWLLRTLKSRAARRKPADVPDTRDAKQRYLDYLIATHQHLPVAGFETNLRVPIPLEKVFVTLHAHMSELERFREDGGAREIGMDRSVTVQEALQFALGRKYDGVVILGNPGAGKTTLAKYFVLCFAAEKAKINLNLTQKFLPILLFLREIDPQKSLLENILAPLAKHQLNLTAEFFEPYLRDGKAILLLDGLDEVPTEEKRQQVSQWIHHQTHLAFPRCPVVVTSRFSGYRGGAVLPGHYLRLEILDYQLTQVKQFLENWLTAVETHVHEDSKHWRTHALQKAGDLYHRLETTPALRELAVNPLMLQIIALVHRDRGTLPERRIELYKECTDVLLERWDKAKGLNVVLSAAEARQLLQPVALWMHSVENRREVGKQEILDYITPILPRLNNKANAEELLQSWQERSGIFKGEGGIYFFHHLSFQEYLTAEEIRNGRKVDILVKNFDKGWWREPTLLAMGLTNPPIFSDFMHALLRAEWRDGARVDFMLRCIDEALVKDEMPFVEALKRLKRFEARYQALCGLERLATVQAKAAVRQALHDKDEQVAGTARTMLAKWGETPVEEKLETLKVTIKGKVQQMPARLFNPVELNAEYILIPGAKEKIVFESTKKSAPDYPLYFAKYPVTNKLYNRFLSYLADENKEALRALPLEQFAARLLPQAKTVAGFAKFLSEDLTAWKNKLDSYHDKRFNGDDQPAVRVSWFAATAYCHWLTMLHQMEDKFKNKNESYIFRLPRDEEWEWAASGGKREYPWGKEAPDETRANYGEKVGHTTPVGAYPAGATPEGLMDMAGNVWEWMGNVYREGSEWRTLRGGSYGTVALRGSGRGRHIPVGWLDDVGFRACVGGEP